MNEMKSKAIEKLMMVLDEVLGGDVADRLKEKMHESTEGEEKEEYGEEGKKTASGGASILALPEAESEDMPSGEKDKMKGIGIEMQDVKVAALPKPGLMKKMRGKLS